MCKIRPCAQALALALSLGASLGLAAGPGGLEAARAAYRAGAMEKVLSHLAPLLQGYDPPEEALVLAGFAQYRLGRFREALFPFAHLVGTLRGGGEAAYGFGLALRALGDLEGARSALDYARRLGYREAEAPLKALPPPPPYGPKRRETPLRVPFRAEKGRFWVGDRPLWLQGVDLGVALPGRFPAEFPEEETLYRAWLELMGAMGANAVRVYTLLPPGFYRALWRHNLLHPDRPLYLLQGVWTELPEERGLSQEAFDGPFLEAFLEEARDVVDAVHGQLLRPPRPGHAHGAYTADVSPWTLAWLVGREFEPYAVLAYNRAHPGRSYRGRFLQALPEAEPFEAWAAEVLDRILAYEAEAYGTLRPVSFSNWPTLDPLYHVSESTREEEAALRRARGERVEEAPVRELNNDEARLDLSLIRPTPGSPATVFANYHAYPYYPDFMNNEPEHNRAVGPLGRSNYFGYLKRLKAHHGDQPVLIGEIGLPTSRGIAHFQVQGLHHGGHSEEGQAQGVVRLLQEIKAAGMAGALVFAWLDEWFKRNWLFMAFEYPPERNSFWHNVLDPEQNYGILAATAPRGFRLDGEAGDWEGVPFLWRGEGAWLKLRADPEYLWLAYRGPLPLRLALDTVAGGARGHGGMAFPFGVEFYLEVGPKEGHLLIEKGYYPYQEARTGGEGTEVLVYRGFTRPGEGPLVPFILEPNRRRTGRDGRDYPRITYELGRLRPGQDPPGARDPTADYALGEILEVRIPWGMLLITDPSTRTAWYAPEPKPIEGIGLYLPGLTPKPLRFAWPTWQAPAFALRLKPLYYALKAFWRGEGE